MSSQTRAALIGIDLAILGIAWCVARWLTVEPVRRSWDADSIRAVATAETLLTVCVMLAATGAMLGLWILAMTTVGAYDPERWWPRMIASPLDGPSRHVVAAAAGTLAAFGCLAILGRSTSWLPPSLSHWADAIGLGIVDPTRLGATSLGFWFLLLGTAGMTGTRLMLRRLVLRARRRGHDLRGLLIVGTGERAVHFATHVHTRRELGYYVAGFVWPEEDDADAVEQAGGAVVTTIGEFPTYLATHVVDEVMVVLSVPSAYAYADHLITLCRAEGVTIHFVSPLFDSRLARGRWDWLDDEPLLTLDP